MQFTMILLVIMFICRFSAKELRKKSCIKGCYACDSECSFCLSPVSYLLPSWIDPKQCRQSMTSMVFEGMHILAMCLSKFFSDGLNDHPVLLAKFYLFVNLQILGMWIVVHRSSGCCLCPDYLI